MAKKTLGKPVVAAKGRYKKNPCTGVRLKCSKDKADLRKAAAIVAHVLAHFGAGYGAERQKSGATGQLQIFAAPAALATFHDLLLTSVLKNLATINWEADQPARDAVCNAAFHHGVLAFQTTPAAPLTFQVILDTLRTIQETLCPAGAGGGPICDF